MQVSIIILRHPHADKPSCPAQRPRRFAQDTGGARRLDLEPSQAWQFPAHRLKNVASRPPKRPIMIVADERNWTCDLPDVGQISLIHSRRFIALVRASTAPNRLRQKANFVCGFKLIGISSPWPRNICLLSHARLRVHWAPGFPCALFFRGTTTCATRARIRAAGSWSCVLS